jgi:hypothetical protein
MYKIQKLTLKKEYLFIEARIGNHKQYYDVSKIFILYSLLFDK